MRGDETMRSILLGDVDGDGTVDIVVGNDRHPNQVLRMSRNNRTFAVFDLPVGDMGTYSVVALGV